MILNSGIKHNQYLLYLANNCELQNSNKIKDGAFCDIDFNKVEISFQNCLKQNKCWKEVQKRDIDTLTDVWQKIFHYEFMPYFDARFKILRSKCYSVDFCNKLKQEAFFGVNLAI